MFSETVLAKPHLLIVDDEKSMCQYLSIMFKKQDFVVDSAQDAESALRVLEQKPFDLVITDYAMPGMSGLDLLKKIKSVSPQTAVIIITAYGTTEIAIEAMKSGAFDYINKPFNNDAIKLTVQKCLQTTQLERENLLLKRQMQVENRFGNLIGASPAMAEVFELIQVVRNNKSNVLLTGESGTGKEMVAREIHFGGDLGEEPFVAVNCGAIPENLMESELFGHRKGAFTGAVNNRVGLFKTAHGGTIFLDEIGELSLSMQVKLLRVIQNKKVRPVGSSEEFPVDVRIVAATNQDLDLAVKEGRFREDLYFRLHVILIHLPPLRDRPKDIPSLTRFLARKLAKEMKRDIHRVSQEALDLLQKYPFPGNIRELENILERSLALEKTNILLPESFPDAVRFYSRGSAPKGEQVELPEQGISLEDHLDQIERSLLALALERAGGVKTEAAKLLHLSFRSFRYRLQKHGLEKAD